MIYKTFIVAEAGINHNGSIIKAKKLVIAAKKSGADAIKFQSYKTDYLIEKKSFNYFNSKKKIY